jgi:glycosyltransferase involved in cell wall biosynthesis
LAFLKNIVFWIWLIRRHKIDLVHLNEHEGYPMLRHALRLTRTPVVVGVRFVLAGGYGQWAFGGKYRPTKLLFTSQDQLNRSWAEIPDGFSEKDIVLFGNGRNFTEFINTPDSSNFIFSDFDLKENEYVLGTASAIREYKYLEDFIDIVHCVKKNGIPVRGFIAGGGRFSDPVYFRSLENRIKYLDAQNYIHLLGNVEIMSDFYRRIDVFISTSHLETFGMSVCEAMAFAKPVVAYTGGAVKEVLGDAENILENGDKSGMVERIKVLLNDDQYYRKCSENNQNRAFSKFNYDVISDKLGNIYHGILDTKQ